MQEALYRAGVYKRYHDPNKGLGKLFKGHKLNEWWENNNESSLSRLKRDGFSMVIQNSGLEDYDAMMYLLRNLIVKSGFSIKVLNTLKMFDDSDRGKFSFRQSLKDVDLLVLTDFTGTQWHTIDRSHRDRISWEVRQLLNDNRSVIVQGTTNIDRSKDYDRVTIQLLKSKAVVTL